MSRHEDEKLSIDAGSIFGPVRTSVYLSPLTLWLLVLTFSIGMAMPSVALAALRTADETTNGSTEVNGKHVGSAKLAGAESRVSAVPFQSFAFGFLCLAPTVTLLIYLIPLKAKQLQVRHQESLRTRYDERERVARDIHDTFLQGIQALLYRLQDWEADATLPAALREEVGGAVIQAAATVDEGRQRILSLRNNESAPEDLTGSLAAFGEGEAEEAGTTFQVRVLGRCRSLTTDAKQQIFDIGREAIRNAYAHAEATHVSVSLEYRRRMLRLEVRDNGRGIDPALSERRMGHFGIPGMRERAAELHGKFSITLLLDRGTSLAVEVPARTAYKDGFRWLSKRPEAKCPRVD